MNEKEKLEIFQASCQVYPQEKRELEKIGNSSKDPDPMNRQMYEYIRQDVSYVEDSLIKIRKKCGTNAELMTWLLYVEGETQMAVAEICHVSRRQLQYAMDRWMRLFLEETNEDMNEEDFSFAFHASARMYEVEKKGLHTLQKTFNQDLVQKQRDQLILNDMSFTEELLKNIEACYGTNARNLIWSVYVKGETQEHMAEEFHMTRRQVQYVIKKYLKSAWIKDCKNL